MMDGKAVQRSRWALLSLWLRVGWRLASLKRNTYVFCIMFARTSKWDWSWQSALIWKRHMLMSFGQLIHDRCLFTRSDKHKRHIKDKHKRHNPCFYLTLAWALKQKSRFQQQTIFLLTLTLISTHFPRLCICYWLCYCFTVSLSHDGALSCNFSNRLYNFRCWLCLYLNIIFLFFFSMMTFSRVPVMWCA